MLTQNDLQKLKLLFWEEIEAEGERTRQELLAEIKLVRMEIDTRLGKIDTQAASKVAKQTISDLLSQKWISLYNSLSTDIQSETTLAQYIQLMTSSGTPTILAANLNGQAQIEYIGGYVYSIQPITFTVRQLDGSTATYQDNYTFILQ